MEARKKAAILVLMDKVDENCQMQLWGKAALVTGVITRDEGVDFFSRIYDLERPQRHPLSEIGFKHWPSMN